MSCVYKPEGKVKVKLFEVVFAWHWHLSLSFSVKYHLFASVCSKLYCRTGCNPTPISFPVLFPKTCYSEFAAASGWQKSKKKKKIFLIHVPKSYSSSQGFSVSKEEMISLQKKILFHQGHCFIYWLWYFKTFSPKTQNKYFDYNELVTLTFLYSFIAENYQYAKNWEYRELEDIYSCKRYFNWIFCSYVHFINA